MFPNMGATRAWLHKMAHIHVGEISHHIGLEVFTSTMGKLVWARGSTMTIGSRISGPWGSFVSNEFASILG